MAFDYGSQRLHAYDANREYFERAGHMIPTQGINWARADDVVTVIGNELAKVPLPEGTRPRIAIDISSCDRQRIAALTLAAVCISSVSHADITFLYSNGDYESVSSEADEPVMVNEPIAGLEGWSGDPDRPLRCVIGLGYEGRMALAALETLEPTSTAAYVATGPDERFVERVRDVNSSILDNSATPVVGYRLDDPIGLLASLDGHVAAASSTSRVVLVPLGPKIFSLCATLVAIMRGADVSVWRVSTGSAAAAQPRSASGAVIGISMRAD